MCLRPGPCEDRIFNLFPWVWAGGTVSTRALLQGPPVSHGDGPGLAAGPLRAAGFTPRAQPPAPSRDRCELPVAPGLKGAAGPRGPASLRGRRRGGDGGAEGTVGLRGGVSGAEGTGWSEGTGGAEGTGEAEGVGGAEGDGRTEGTVGLRGMEELRRRVGG